MGVENELSQDKVASGWSIMWGGGGSAANTHQRRDHRVSVKFQIPGERLESHGEIRMDVEDRVAHVSHVLVPCVDLCFAMEV